MRKPRHREVKCAWSHIGATCDVEFQNPCSQLSFPTKSRWNRDYYLSLLWSGTPDLYLPGSQILQCSAHSRIFKLYHLLYSFLKTRMVHILQIKTNHELLSALFKMGPFLTWHTIRIIHKEFLCIYEFANMNLNRNLHSPMYPFFQIRFDKGTHFKFD